MEFIADWWDDNDGLFKFVPELELNPFVEL